MCPPFGIVRLYTVVRRREERATVARSAIRVFCARVKRARREGSTFSFSLSLSSSVSLPVQREEGETLSSRERERNAKTLHRTRVFGGEWRERRESPSVADGFAGNARLLKASRGTRRGPCLAPIGHPDERGSRPTVALRGLRQSGILVPGFLSRYLHRGRRRRFPPVVASQLLARTRTLHPLRPPRARSPCALVGAGENTLVLGSVEVARVFTRQGEKCSC